MWCVIQLENSCAKRIHLRFTDKTSDREKNIYMIITQIMLIAIILISKPLKSYNGCLHDFQNHDQFFTET